MVVGWFSDIAPTSHEKCCYSRQNLVLPSLLLTLLIGHQEEHLACKKLNDEVLAWLSVWSKVQTRNVGQCPT